MKLKIIVMSVGLLAAVSAFGASLNCHGWGPAADSIELTIPQLEVLAPEFTEVSNHEYKFKARTVGAHVVDSTMVSVNTEIQIESAAGKVLSRAGVTFSSESEYFDLHVGTTALYCKARF